MDTRIEIRIAANGLEARARIAAGPAADPAILRPAVAAAGVTFGLDEESIRELENRLGRDPVAAADQVIARGIAPTAGTDGRIDWLVESERRIGTEREDGGLDYREQHHLLSVRQGQALANWQEPGTGKAGRGVDGREIAGMTGRSPSLSLGPGLALDARGVILALRDGVLLRTDGRADVVDLFEHMADVDLESGNLRLRGSIVVKGTVQPGFEVAATGDVLILGDADGATLTAGGSVTVNKALLGGPGAHVRAGQDVRCRIARNAVIECRGEMSADRELAASRVSARSLRVDPPRARLVGGETVVRESAFLRDLGGGPAAPTLLVVGEPWEEAEELVAVEREAARTSRQMNKASRGEPDVRGRSGKAGRQGLENDARVLRARLRLARARTDLAGRAVIHVLGTIHGGVTLRIGPKSLSPEAGVKGLRLRYDVEQDQIIEEKIS